MMSFYGKKQGYIQCSADDISLSSYHPVSHNCWHWHWGLNDETDMTSWFYVTNEMISPT